MGVSASPEILARKLGRLAGDFRDLPRAQVQEASLVVKTSVMALAPNRLRGVGKRGAKLGVRYNEGMFEGDARSLVYATGPFQLIERDTRPHRIPRQRSRGRQRYAVIPGVGVRAYAMHPGTKGKHPWEHGVDAATPVVRKIFQSTGAFAIHRVFF